MKQALCLIQANSDRNHCINTANYDAKTAFNKCKSAYSIYAFIAEVMFDGGRLVDSIQKCEQQRDSTIFAKTARCDVMHQSDSEQCVE